MDTGKDEEVSMFLRIIGRKKYHLHFGVSLETFEKYRLHAKITQWFSNGTKVKPQNGYVTYEVRAREKTVIKFLNALDKIVTEPDIKISASYEEVQKKI